MWLRLTSSIICPCKNQNSLIDYIFSGNSTKEANKYIMQTTHSFPIQSIIMQYNMTQYNILQLMQHNKIVTIIIILSYNYPGEEEFSRSQH